ncbi:MAG: hypothetical protein OEZ54_10710, partial [Gemmatimonadota bacterium]|nr:hypothetical protein [Gemmatimonadota bacterium]
MDTIHVAVPSFVEPPGNDYYGLIGSNWAHPQNHYGTPEFVEALDSLARRFFSTNEQPLEFNDMSLVGGGVFRHTTNNFFTPPHHEHRVGTNVDLRTRNWTPTQLETIR